VVLLGAAGATAALVHQHSASQITTGSPRSVLPRTNFSADGFAAYYPKKPTRGSMNLNLGSGGSMVTHMYMADLGNDAVGVGVSTLPGGRTIRNPGSVLEFAARFSARGFGLTVTTLRHLTLAGDPAVDMIAKDNNGIAMQSRFIFHNRRMYQILGVGTHGTAPEYAPFLASFRFV
jgi:hypothetical protein